MSSSELPDRIFDTISQDTIELVRNDDNTYFVDLTGYNQTTKAYEPLNLTDVTEIFMTARDQKVNDITFQVSKTAGNITIDGDPIDGQITISVPNSDTNMEDELYNYDIEVQWGTIKRTPVIGKIKVAKDVTYP